MTLVQKRFFLGELEMGILLHCLAPVGNDEASRAAHRLRYQELLDEYNAIAAIRASDEPPVAPEEQGGSQDVVNSSLRQGPCRPADRPHPKRLVRG